MTPALIKLMIGSKMVDIVTKKYFRCQRGVKNTRRTGSHCPNIKKIIWNCLMMRLLLGLQNYTLTKGREVICQSQDGRMWHSFSRCGSNTQVLSGMDLSRPSFGICWSMTICHSLNWCFKFFNIRVKLLCRRRKKYLLWNMILMKVPAYLPI